MPTQHAAGFSASHTYDKRFIHPWKTTFSAFIILLAGCTKANNGNTLSSSAPPTTLGQYDADWNILDFESPAPAIEFTTQPLVETPPSPASAPSSPSISLATQPTPIPTGKIDLFSENLGNSSATTAPAAVNTAPPAAPPGKVTLPAPPPVENPPTRTARAPQAGLWALEAHMGEYGQILHRFSKPIDFRKYETFAVEALQNSGEVHNGHVTAAAVLIDADGRRAVGDAYPLITRWQTVPLDLKTAGDAPERGGSGLDMEHIVAVGVEFRADKSQSSADPASHPWTVETDTWRARTSYHAYVGQRLGFSQSFYVQRNGPRLQIGQVDKYEIVFHERAGAARPWLEINQGAAAARVVGGADTGLMLLDQDAFDAANPQSQLQSPPASRPESPPAGENPKPQTAAAPAPTLAHLHPWMADLSTFEWSVVWTSSIAALVEVKQIAGPFDSLGRPAMEATWKFMIYQTGEMFVWVEWKKTGDVPVPVPVSLALACSPHPAEAVSNLNSAGPNPADDWSAQRVLAGVYPESWRLNWKGDLPHEYQAGNPVGMLAKIRSTENLWWRGQFNGNRLFGVGIPANMRGADETGGFLADNESAAPAAPQNSTTQDSPATATAQNSRLPPAPGGQGAVTCVILANHPTALDEAGMFSQYLVPPALEMGLGELDRNFPGDMDNDSLVEATGFQTIRLANGKARFVLDPQGRPIFYPTFLITIPPEDRAKIDLKKHVLILNVDGKQIGGTRQTIEAATETALSGADAAPLPRWPDGSFLVQLPWVISKRVRIEAEMVEAK